MLTINKSTEEQNLGLLYNCLYFSIFSKKLLKIKEEILIKSALVMLFLVTYFNFIGKPPFTSLLLPVEYRRTKDFI